MMEAKDLSVIDEVMMESFAKEIVGQNTLMDSIGKQLITMELAIPAIYATGLKLISGKNGVISDDGYTLLMIGFGFWFVSLICSFVAIFPKKYTIDKSSITEIEEFYSKSARHKAKYLSWGGILFFFGIISTMLSMIK